MIFMQKITIPKNKWYNNDNNSRENMPVNARKRNVRSINGWGWWTYCIVHIWPHWHKLWLWSRRCCRNGWCEANEFVSCYVLWMSPPVWYGRTSRIGDGINQQRTLHAMSVKSGDVGKIICLIFIEAECDVEAEAAENYNTILWLYNPNWFVFQQVQ